MKVILIKWRDALAVEGDNSPPLAALATLESVGFLLHEGEDAILIGMETCEGAAGRWRLNIPKNQILSMVYLTPKPISKKRGKGETSHPPVVALQT